MRRLVLCVQETCDLTDGVGDKAGDVGVELQRVLVDAKPVAHLRFSSLTRRSSPDAATSPTARCYDI